MADAAAIAARLVREVGRAREQSEALELAPVTRTLRPPRPAPSSRPARSSVPRSSSSSSGRRLLPSLPRLPKRAAALSAGTLVGGGLVVFALLALLKGKRAAAAPSLPAPTMPPAKPPSSSSTAPTTPPAKPPSSTGEPVPSWSRDGLTLNALSGYHRAKQKEVGPEIVRLSPSFLKHDVGTIHFVEADGRAYAVAIEGSHTNHPEIGPRNKGVSLFVRDS